VYLVDTNIWLERLLDQARSQEVGDFLERIPADCLYVTDFTLHSIGIVLVKLGEGDAFLNFVKDVITDGGVRLAGMVADEMMSVIKASTDYKLDFDDAYQYATAVKFDFEIVSFDADFDRTERKRKSPAEIEPIG
jgi:uncharacterized protein